MKKSILLFLAYVFFILPQWVSGQDSITIQDLEKFSYTFSIEDGVFKGEGAEILTKAIAESHITMLAENAGYKLEHQLTNALVNELDEHQYKKMVLETGGASGALINKMAKNKRLTERAIKKINQQYLIEKKERTFIPILELKSIEGIHTLENAQSRGWTFLSLGIEPWSSYKMHLDNMYNSLNSVNKGNYKQLYKEAIVVLDKGYETIQAHNSNEVFKLISQIKSSISFHEFLDKMLMDEANQEIVKAVRQSIDYYWMYGNKEFYKKNVWSAAKDKAKLVEDLKNNHFNFQEDKLFVKMWRNHLSKGMAVSGAHGVGNMLIEVADYHGNKSLTIGVISRFYKDGEEVKDLLQASDGFTKRYKELIQLGKKNDWVLVDLRPFIKEFYYGRYIQSDGLYKMFSRYDMLVIPKTDEQASANY